MKVCINVYTRHFLFFLLLSNRYVTLAVVYLHQSAGLFFISKNGIMKIKLFFFNYTEKGKDEKAKMGGEM